jgi:hypothetical protein
MQCTIGFIPQLNNKPKTLIHSMEVKVFKIKWRKVVFNREQKKEQERNWNSCCQPPGPLGLLA